MPTPLQTLLATAPYAGLTDQQAAAAINALTASQPVTTFGSFRTLGLLLTATEYNTLRAALEAAITAEPTNYFLADMKQAMLVPGGSDGSGGGLNFSDPNFVAQLQALCTAAGTACSAVPGKIGTYASKSVLWTRINNGGRPVTAAQVNAARNALTPPSPT